MAAEPAQEWFRPWEVPGSVYGGPVTGEVVQVSPDRVPLPPRLVREALATASGAWLLFDGDGLVASSDSIGEIREATRRREGVHYLVDSGRRETPGDR